MSTPDSPPAGWYADPENPRQLRWWDGRVWTEHLSAIQAPGAAATTSAASTTSATTGTPDAGAAQQLSAPAGTDWKTPWIWLVLFLPLVGLLPVLFVPWADVVRIDPATGQPDPDAALRLLTSPAFLLSTFLPFLLYALSVLFSYLDWRELSRRRIAAPFHWAWAFLGNSVYPIGRGVVVQRRTGRGAIVTWLAIALIVLSILIGTGLAVWISVTALSQVPFS
ncbi:DUF2510 domain-containing protein [Naasia aerilata]|uniref:DUF2510 domain-containing protein n=1 Tax=Naasia aerilata TaxID=1162966 RepID=A0ABN6XIZ1_9MICO|nr:DUF2510 domain-containing protein [Naasia aerilata]BDZ44795.1 hypothetical protein GCM10025866_07040 [Naasia aerilata]